MEGTAETGEFPYIKKEPLDDTEVSLTSNGADAETSKNRFSGSKFGVQSLPNDATVKEEEAEELNMQVDTEQMTVVNLRLVFGDNEWDKLDTESLIAEVKQHPEVWDITIRAYNDCAKKQLAWERICMNLFEDYNEKTENEKIRMMKKLIEKWRDIRNNYAASFRKIIKSGGEHRYMYAGQLSFLKESMALLYGTHSIDNNLESPPRHKKEKSSPDTVVASSISAVPRSSSPLIDLMNTPIVIEAPNADRSFFDALFPIIRNFTEDQKLEFRSEVIKAVRKVKRQGKTLPETQPQSTPRQPIVIHKNDNKFIYRFPP